MHFAHTLYKSGFIDWHFHMQLNVDKIKIRIILKSTAAVKIV